MTLDDRNGEYQLDSRDKRIVDDLVRAGEGKVRPFAEVNLEAQDALRSIPKSLGESLEIHGFRSHATMVSATPEGRRRDNFEALIRLVRTGRLKGGIGRLHEGQLYAEAPFLIVSQPNRPLVNPDTGKVNGFCLVNGQYSALVNDLRRSFPSIPFITPEDIRGRWREIFKDALAKDPSLAK